MSEILLVCAIVMLCCVFVNVVSRKFDMPALLLFMALGMIFGSDGLFKIPFDNYEIMQQISTIALVLIIFYGGFSTKWQTAKPVVKQATLLSTLGVVLTALLTAGFCYYVLKIDFAESFLIGAVISSTDAASVFAILRSKNMNLKYSTAPLLELESGSNDPFSYMLTIIGIALLTGKSVDYVPLLFVKQIVLGILIGVVSALAGIWVMKKNRIVTEGIRTIFIMAIVFLAFALPDVLGGNGLLSVYIAGIILGNAKIKNTNVLVNFFDGLTSLAQLLIFFMSGLTSFPHKMPEIIVPATLIALFLTFVARPVAVFSLMLPFKSTISQCILVSWAGLRGAASIVFAVLVVASVSTMPKYDLFHIVFLISLLSVSFQGTMLPIVAKWTNMIDENSDVRKTFNDYQEKSALSLIQILVNEEHNWANKSLKDIALPHDTLALLLKRDEKDIVPKGNTVLQTGDTLVLSVPVYNSEDDVELEEMVISKNHSWNNKLISEIDLPKNLLIVSINRDGDNIIPRGNTKFYEDDIVVVFKQPESAQ